MMMMLAPMAYQGDIILGGGGGGGDEYAGRDRYLRTIEPVSVLISSTII